MIDYFKYKIATTNYQELNKSVSDLNSKLISILKPTKVHSIITKDDVYDKIVKAYGMRGQCIAEITFSFVNDDNEDCLNIALDDISFVDE